MIDADQLDHSENLALPDFARTGGRPEIPIVKKQKRSTQHQRRGWGVGCGSNSEELRACKIRMNRNS